MKGFATNLHDGVELPPVDPTLTRTNARVAGVDLNSDISSLPGASGSDHVLADMVALGQKRQGRLDFHDLNPSMHPAKICSMVHFSLRTD